MISFNSALTHVSSFKRYAAIRVSSMLSTAMHLQASCAHVTVLETPMIATIYVLRISIHVHADVDRSMFQRYHQVLMETGQVLVNLLRAVFPLVVMTVDVPVLRSQSKKTVVVFPLPQLVMRIVMIYLISAITHVYNCKRHASIHAS